MSDNQTLESKSEEITSTQPAPVEAKKSEDSKLENDESKNIESDKIDYKALLEAEQAKTLRAEDKIVKLKKQNKGNDRDEDEDEEIEKEDLNDRVAALVKEQVAAISTGIRSEIISSEIDDLINELSSNPDEQRLIKHVYENRIKASGFSRAEIRDDILNAKVLANRDSIVKTNKELAAALHSRATTSTSANSSTDSRVTDAPTTTYSADEQRLLDRASRNK